MSTSATPPPGPPAGWYDDPGGSGRRRYWDGTRWTDALAPEGARPAPSPFGGGQAARSWALAAHLSALGGLVTGLPFLGPLIVDLVKRDDPLVHDHAAEALNFNLSVTLYGLVLGLVTVLLVLVLVGLLLIPVLIALAVAWLVFVVMAAVRASRGEPYRYPLTIRFVS